MIPRLCFVTDASAPLSIVEQAERAARGGAGWVQLRHKTIDDAGFADLAEALLEKLRPLGCGLILNDRVEIACAFACAGVHIGQSDGNCAEVRERLGPDKILGLSIETETQLAKVPAGTVDYLGVGPVRATASKADHAAPLGFDGLERLCLAAREPVMAIGGLTAADVPLVLSTGAASMAVVSAISRSADPEEAARAFTKQWNIT